MNTATSRFLWLAATLLALSVSPTAGESSAPAADWLDGAAGYEAALQASEATGKPLLLYFYTDWCPYCRQLDRNVLPTDEVRAELEEMIAVRVNSEAGPDEQRLASEYGIPGVPALFVHSQSGVRSIRWTVAGADGVRPKTPEEFAATLAAAR